MSFSAEAPSNIALIKYMGKRIGEGRNRPTNPSLSYTLSELKTRVEISEFKGAQDVWTPLNKPDWVAPNLSDKAKNRFLIHFKFLKQKLGIEGAFEVRSANNFPPDCGLASSASSFAALTKATFELAKSLNPNLDTSLKDLSDLSRIGSGSSIRSFFSPWCLWSDNGASEIETAYPKLLHQAIIVEDKKKLVSSSEAHERVITSLLFEGRSQRAEVRLSELTQALTGAEWQKAFHICWEEFFDMHALFETSRPAFGYMTPGSLKVLNWLKEYWSEKGDGPLVTMDAGPNIHLLYRPDQLDVKNLVLKEFSKDHNGEFHVI